MIAGAGSSSGKTTLMLGLLALLKDEDLAAFKVGPDFIDPLFHTRVLGLSSTNLDGFFQSASELKGEFAKRAADYNLIEGVMGYYDGQKLDQTTASSYDVARILDAPVLLVVNLSGMGHSVCALIKGFLTHRQPSFIRGVVLNHCSEGLYQKLAPVIWQECGIEAIGYIPRMPDLMLSSRELGLAQMELSQLRDKVDRLAEVLGRTIDLAKLRQWMQETTPLERPVELESPVADVAIGLARDEAFGFYYQANLELLISQGARIIEFSPLHDRALPPVAALYLGGGFQTEYAAELSANQSMRRAIRDFQGPIWAEGGGYFYLCDGLCDKEGDCYPLAGRLSGQVRNTHQLGRFGYQLVSPPKESLFGTGEIKAHEFHYWRHDKPGSDLLIHKGDRHWPDGYATSALIAGYQYYYLPSQPKAARAFLNAARRYDETKRD